MTGRRSDHALSQGRAFGMRQQGTTNRPGIAERRHIRVVSAVTVMTAN